VGHLHRGEFPHATGATAYLTSDLADAKSRVVHWVPGPGSYRRNDAGDAGIDAALLSKAVGRSVRVQGMRYEGHGWDPKGPASIHRARAALDQDGAVIGYAFESKGFSRIDIDTNESDPAYSLAGQLMGLPLKSLQGFGVPAESYGFANKQLAWETVAPLLDRASPLRTAHLRDPVGPQILASAAKQSRALCYMPIEIASSPSASRNSPSACAI
jgi:nicotinate dehydrogenase subunit B